MGITIQRSAAWRRGSRFLILLTVLVAAGTFWAAASAEAEPVTLRFEAIVGPPRDGMAPIDLPFSFVEGDPIDGSFTFEPFDAPSDLSLTNATQNFPFRLQIGSFRLETAIYQIEVVDNLVSDEEPIPEDRIRMLCSSFLAEPTCDPSYIPESQTIDWAFGVTLNALADAIDGADVPAEAAVWNQFLPGSILVTFRDIESAKASGFQATIQSFVVVPEPTTCSLAFIVCFLGESFLRSRRRR